MQRFPITPRELRAWFLVFIAVWGASVWYIARTARPRAETISDLLQQVRTNTEMTRMVLARLRLQEERSLSRTEDLKKLVETMQNDPELQEWLLELERKYP